MMKTKGVTDKKIYDNYLKYNLEMDDKPDTILGVWIINHSFKSKKNDKDLEIKGEYEINVWYSYADNKKTDVATKRIEYDEIIPKVFNTTSDYRLKCLGNPSCNKANIENDTIIIEIFKQFEIEVIEEVEIIEEKPEKIEKIRLENNHIVNIKENEKHYVTTNVKDRDIYIPRINWLINRVNYLLKKEDE